MAIGRECDDPGIHAPHDYQPPGGGPNFRCNGRLGPAPAPKTRPPMRAVYDEVGRLGTAGRDNVERLTRRVYQEEEPEMQCNSQSIHGPHDHRPYGGGPDLHCPGELGPARTWVVSATLLEHAEPENDVCGTCAFECVDGWREEYNTDECPDCGGRVVTKYAKRIAQSTIRAATRRRALETTPNPETTPSPKIRQTGRERQNA